MDIYPVVVPLAVFKRSFEVIALIGLEKGCKHFFVKIHVPHAIDEACFNIYELLKPGQPFFGLLKYRGRLFFQRLYKLLIQGLDEIPGKVTQQDPFHAQGFYGLSEKILKSQGLVLSLDSAQGICGQGDNADILSARDLP